MPGHPGRTPLLAAMLLFASSGALPARAQDQSAAPRGRVPATLHSLSEEVAQLQARIAKLEGKVKAADLVGTYAMVFIDAPVSAGVPGRNASITTAVGTGTVKLNADMTYTISYKLAYNVLTEGSWTLTHGEDAGTVGGTWTLANGVVTLTQDDPLGDPPLELFVSRDGAVLTGAQSEFQPGNQESDSILVIATRIRRAPR